MFELYTTDTIDVHRSTNMAELKSEVCKKETRQKRERKIIPMSEVHDVSDTNTRHRKASYANIVRGR